MAECSDSSVSVNNTNVPKQKTTPAESGCAKEEKTDKVLSVEEMITGLCPESFSRLEQELVKNRMLTLNSKDIIVCLVYLMMLEEGFVPSAKAGKHRSITFDLRQILDLATCMPTDWKRASDGTYRVDFAFMQDYCSIVCIPSQEDLIINCVSNVCGRYTMPVDCRLFVLETNNKMFFQNIRMLAVNFKNSIAFPAKMDIHTKNKYPAACLKDLPLEMKHYICKYIGKTFREFINILDE